MRLALNYNNYRLVWPRAERRAGRGRGGARLFNCKFAREVPHASRTDAPMIKQHEIIINFAP
jgi:hypothetical protein